MTKNNTTTSGSSFSVVAVLAVLFGLLVFGYGLLLVPVSVLGGAWVAAIGLSLLLAGVFATRWVGDRLELSAADQHTLSVAFSVLAVFLLVAYVVVNFASFELGGTVSY
ncbi:hypothetical protein [Haladaptatus sp. CMAA 1911]|uniref:hypothetical protein n=1 Tax=unclassified Haladaptatus TaxID=2622732 RepID=UPI0037550670